MTPGFFYSDKALGFTLFKYSSVVNNLQNGQEILVTRAFGFEKADDVQDTETMRKVLLICKNF